MPADRPAARLRVRDGQFDLPVLERLITALCARVDMPLDRIDDARLVAGAILEQAWQASPDGWLELTLTTHGDTVRLTVGPLVADGATRVVTGTTLPGVGSLVGRLARGWTAEMAPDGGESLAVTLG